MLKIGLKNLDNTCWFNSIMQLLCSISEINDFLTKYTGNDEIIKKLQIFNAIIHDHVKENKDYHDIIKKRLITNLKLDCSSQNEASEFLDKLLSNNDEIYLLYKRLFEYNNSEIILFNKNIGQNSFCPIPTKKVTKYANKFIIYAEEINNNDNLIDKMYLTEEIITNNTGNRKCIEDVKISGDVLIINNKNLESNYILINYIPYKKNLNNTSTGLELSFKPIELYKKFSYNNNNYIIKGIIIHVGTTPDGRVGHFYYLEYINNKWIKYNDNEVSELKQIERQFISDNILAGSKEVEINILRDNIYFFNDINKKPVLILYNKIFNRTIYDQYEDINFNFDDHIEKRQELINYYQLLSPELLRQNQQPAAGAASRLQPLPRPQLQLQPDLRQQYNMTQEEKDLEEAIAKSLEELQQASQTSIIKPIDELSVSINRYLDFFKKA